MALSALVLLVSATAAVAAKPPQPAARLPLAALGFPGYPVALMHAGASMATLHVLDANHLLFTYALRSLVPRLPGDDENDHDRMVGAEVVEVSSGKVLARTEWHLHDYGQYLWNAGHGAFVLRSGNELFLLAPLRGLHAGAAFQRTPLPHRPGRPMIIYGSPDGQVLTVELQKQGAAPEDGAPVAPGAPGASKEKHTIIEFFRLAVPENEEAAITVRPAGVIGSPRLLRLALDGDGYLWADDLESSRWKVSFNEYEGKAQPLATVNSTCSPRLQLLSRSEFAVMSCGTTGSEEMLTAYGFDGHENWEEHLGEASQAPTFVAASEAGRFALGRVMPFSGQPTSGLAHDDSTLAEEIRVYGTETGDMLLNVSCTPVARTLENFDLSSDGRTLAVLSPDAINIYKLPELSTRDRKELAEAATMVPPTAHGPVDLRHITRPVAEEEGPVSAEETTAPSPAMAKAPEPASVGAPVATPIAPPGAGGAPVPASPQAGTPVQNGDAAPVEDAPARRKPPTLLNPGEVPEAGKPKQGPAEP